MLHRVFDTLFGHFVAATLAGITPGDALYVYRSLLERAAASEGSSGTALKWVFFSMGLAATIAVVLLVTRKAMADGVKAG